MNLNGVSTQVVRVEEGGDYFLGDHEELPYRLVKNLGHGHSATVEMIEDIVTRRTFARKIFRIGGKKDPRRQIFQNEIKVIQRLEQHHHIIRVFATYMSRKEAGLILNPVASQGDLESYLQDFRDGQCDQTAVYTLTSAFGCLASGLLFMHTQHVRHKDIKPRNILIHDNSVIYTDFGFSLDHSTATGSTTTGRPDALTRKYCAPEVQECEPRNTKSDIFSLGCVFFEIFASLGSCDLPEEPEPYHQRIDEVQQIVQSSFRSGNEWSRVIGDLICTMLENHPDQRPPTLGIVKELWENYQGLFCSRCRETLPGYSQTDFPRQPLNEFYGVQRVNFTPGWIRTEQMMSEGSLFTRMITETNAMEHLWTPAQHPRRDFGTPIPHRLATPCGNRSDDHAPKGSFSNSPQVLSTTNSSRPVYYPATPDFALLKRTSTVVHDSLPTPRSSTSPPPKTNFGPVLGNGGAPTSPSMTRAAAATVESSPKTYAMALAGDRDRTPVARLPQRFLCPYGDCSQIFMSEAERQNHLAMPSLPYTCKVPGCERSKHGFTFIYQLENHVDIFHVIGSGSYYTCGVQNCHKKDRIWYRIETVRRHVLLDYHPADIGRFGQHQKFRKHTKRPNRVGRTQSVIAFQMQQTAR